MSSRSGHPRTVKRKNRTAPSDSELEGFEILSIIVGRGSYSNIWRAKSHTDPHLKLAVKICPKNARRAKINYEGAVYALNKLQHSNIIRLVHHQETSEFYYEFMEYIDKPAITLSHLLEQSEYCIPASLVAPILAQLASALAHMHSRAVGHRDIKPDNIMIHPETLHVTIIDFGFAVSTLEPCDDFCGSPIFAAPEILNFQPFRVDLADLWSLGVVLFLLCYGTYPFPAQTMPELTAKVTRDPVKFPVTSSATIRELQPALFSLLTKDPTQRISAASLAAAFAPFDTIRQFTPQTELEEDPMEIEVTSS